MNKKEEDMVRYSIAQNPLSKRKASKAAKMSFSTFKRRAKNLEYTNQTNHIEEET